MTRLALVLLAGTALCGPALAQSPVPPGDRAALAALPGVGPSPVLPAPDPQHEAARFSRVVGWPEGRAPAAPAGFAVTRFAGGLDSPRWLHVLPNGDVLVAEATTEPRPTETEAARAKQEGMRRSGSVGRSANRVTLLRDADGDGVPEARHALLEGLNQPFGMAFAEGYLFVANTDGVLRFPFRPGQTRVEAKGERILALPAGGYNNHWTRNLLLSRDGRRLHVSVGSASNVGERGLGEEEGRALILSINLDGSDAQVFASGLRNPVGMGFEPRTGALWTAVNERDELGDDLVPDYITSVRQGGFYGWPYSYYGQNVDPRRAGERPDLVARAIAPDYALGPHTASLGLAFYDAAAFPERYRGGAFVGQRGSWNRSSFSGYRVAFVPFADGRPSGPPQDFLTGFLADPATGEAHGRPVGVAVDRAGALLVADDAGGTVWRVAPAR